jgi:hypothetical protein
MEVPNDFSGRLRLALKVANLSPVALGAAVGVDKSVVSRWLSGRVRPTQHNLARVADCLANRLPGFTVLAFDGPEAEFARLLGGESTGTGAGVPSQNLPVPFGLLDTARVETARRGVEYCGLYTLYYWSFGLPGKIARMALMLQPQDGLIEARYGADGFAFRGWALLLLNRMYVILAEERFEAMAFLVTNAGQQPRARFITGLLTGPAEGLLAPTVSPAVLVRSGELTGDPAGDAAAFAAAAAEDAIAEREAVPPAALRALESAGAREGPLLQMPYATGEDL